MRNNYKNKKLTLRRKKGGGFIDSLKQTFSDLGSKISQTANTAWNQTKRATGMTDSSTSSSSTSPTSSSSMTYSTPSTSYSSSPSTASLSSSQSSSSSQSQPYGSYGGRRKRMKKTKLSHKMRGGQYKDNISLTNIASKAAPFSGETARPHNMVGGPVRMLGGAKSRRHHKKRSHCKSKKH